MKPFYVFISSELYGTTFMCKNESEARKMFLSEYVGHFPDSVEFMGVEPCPFCHQNRATLFQGRNNKQFVLCDICAARGSIGHAYTVLKMWNNTSKMTFRKGI